MIPYLTLGVGVLSLLATLFLAWVLAARDGEEKVEYTVGFRMPTPQEGDADGGE